MKLVFTEKDCLEAAVAEIIGEEELVKRLRAGEKLRIKLGIDPTSPHIHLGRSIVLWRLRAFQELGHEVHFIVGDFTGQVGDTSDKESERPMLSAEQIKENLATYMDQVWMILNPEKKTQVRIHYNSKWLAGLNLGKISELADLFSVNQFMKRELVAKRLEKGDRVSLREMLYPLMQGYDSVQIKADVELGGTDQRFNMLAGRTLQEHFGQLPQAIIMNVLINGTDGQKMSSSKGNVISLLDTPADKFGKIMSLPDPEMKEYLQVLPLSAQPFHPEELGTRLNKGENPRDLKLQLAEALVALYHGDVAAKQTREQFIAQFKDNRVPDEVDEVEVAKRELPLVELMVESGLVMSKTEARRLIEQGGVRVDGTVIDDMNVAVTPKYGMLVQVGKRKFVRII